MDSFEVKIKLLQMAHEILDNEAAYRRNKEEYDWTVAKEKAIKNPSMFATIPDYPTPNCPTPEKVVEAARELYKFFGEGNG